MVKNQKLNIIFHLLCAVTIATAAGIVTAAAQSREPKTVADFLLLVPERYMVGYDLRLREELLRGDRRGVVVDIPKPRRGKSIEVWDGRDRKLYTLTWRNDQFRISRVAGR